MAGADPRAAAAACTKTVQTRRDAAPDARSLGTRPAPARGPASLTLGRGPRNLPRGIRDGHARATEGGAREPRAGPAVNRLARAADGLGRLNRVLLGLCRIATVLLCAGLTGVVAVGVFWRYVLNDALSWTEEVAKLAMVWLTFTGAPLALVAGGHVAIEMLPRLLPRRLRHLLLAVVLLVVALVLAVLAWRGTTFAWNGRTQVVAMLGDVSMAWVFAAIPIGSLIMLAIAVEQAIRHLLHALAPDRHAAPVAEGAMAGVD